MNSNTPLSPRPLRHLSDAQRRVLSLRQLREHGISSADAAERTRPGGCWQRLLPGVYLLHPGPPTSEERLHAALLYADRPPATGLRPGAPPSAEGSGETAMISGLAALTLHGFSSTPPLRALERIDVLVPRTRRVRSAGLARILRSGELPEPEEITGLPVVPVPRALADAVAQLSSATAVRRLLTEAVRGGHCEPGAVVSELSRARLLSRPHVIDAVDTLLAEGRALAEGRLYELVRSSGLPEPLWNVELRLPGGPHLGSVDAYWPDCSVALAIDARSPRQDENTAWAEGARKRERLERLGITVVHTTPKKLREAMDQQAAVVRTALMSAGDREPAEYVIVLPR
ncbi:hypothetical protein [Streptomyces sp. NPDC051776]|uniref:hypothetical protein n=1 Tax=Streptomyces sp. NPDC051776 TaxID=3155414 RepID=UPI0034317CB3